MRKLLTLCLCWVLVVMSVACAEVPIPGGEGGTPTPTSAPPTGTVTPSPTETPDPGGIEGQTLMGPACPGPVRVDTPCPDVPVQATITIINAAGEQVAEVKSDEQGLFTILLPSGTYTLQPEPLNALQQAAPQVVTVEAGKFISVTITYDSGMR